MTPGPGHPLSVRCLPRSVSVTCLIVSIERKSIYGWAHWIRVLSNILNIHFSSNSISNNSFPPVFTGNVYHAMPWTSLSLRGKKAFPFLNCVHNTSKWLFHCKIDCPLLNISLSLSLLAQLVIATQLCTLLLWHWACFYVSCSNWTIEIFDKGWIANCNKMIILGNATFTRFQK